MINLFNIQLSGAAIIKRMTAVALIFTGALHVRAEVILADSFSQNGATGSERIGWTLDWVTHQGSASTDTGDLALPGYKSSEGLMKVPKESMAVCQIEQRLEEVIYGSVRVSPLKLNPDALIGISICDHEMTLVRPELTMMTILSKGWRVESGSAFLDGKRAKPNDGVPLLASEVYLILFKLDGSDTDQTELTVWILDQSQAVAFGKQGLDEELLKHASVGELPLQVSQSLSVVTPYALSKIYLDGSVFSLMSRYGAVALFDELSLSTSSFAEAAGLLQPQKSSLQKIPYIQQ
jgi:hypothetical protein